MGIAAYVLGAIGMVVGLAIGRFVLASPMQRKLESFERAKARQGKAYEEIEAENKQFQTQLLEAEKEAEKRIQELDTAYQTQLQEKDRAYQAQIQALQEGAPPVDLGTSEDHIQAHQTQIQELQASHQAAIQSLEQSFQQQMQDLQGAHQAALEEQRQSYQAQIQDLQQAHQAEIRDLEASYQGQIREMEQSRELQEQPPIQEEKDASGAATEAISEGVDSAVAGIAGTVAGIDAGTEMADFPQGGGEEESASTFVEGAPSEGGLSEGGFEFGRESDSKIDEIAGFVEENAIAEAADTPATPVLDSMPVDVQLEAPIDSLEGLPSLDDYSDDVSESMAELPDFDDSPVDHFDRRETDSALNSILTLDENLESTAEELNETGLMDILEGETSNRLEELPVSPELPASEAERDSFEGIFGGEAEASDLEFLSMLQTEDASTPADLKNNDDPFALGKDEYEALFGSEELQEDGDESGFDSLFEELSLKEGERTTH